MASQYTPLDATFPRTLVTDVSPSQLQAHESPDLRNVITSEPGHVRVRKGFRRAVEYFAEMTEPRDSVLTGVQQVGQRVSLSYNVFTGSEVLDEWLPLYYFSRAITGVSTAEGASRSVVLDAGSPNGDTWAVDGEFVDPALGSFVGRKTSVIGKTINYGSFSYGVTTREIARRHRQYAHDAQSNQTNTALVRWNGGDPSVDAYSAIATVTNGSVSVTLNADPTSGGSLVGTLMRLGAGITAAEAPRAGYWYTYLVIAHSGTSVTLQKPYGLGEPATNVPNLTAEPVDFVVESEVANAPLGVQAVEVYKDRIFTGRGHILPAVGGFHGYYGNLIAWSEPGEPEKWPAQNFIIVDDQVDHPITGLASVAGVLLIFTRFKTYVLSGSDESSFVVDKFSDNIGCIFSGSICNFEDRVVWAHENGICSFDGETLEELTQPEQSRGIRSTYRQRMNKDDLEHTKFYQRWPRITAHNDNLFVALADSRRDENDTSFVYNARDKSWIEFGRRLSEGNFSSDLTAEDMMLKGWVTQNGVVYGLMDWQMVNVDGCFGYDFTEAAAPRFITISDEYYDDTGSQQIDVPTAVIQFPDLRLGDGDTVRVKEVQVEHASHFNEVTEQADERAWTLSLGTDPTFTTATTYDVNARWIEHADYPSTLYVSPDLFYADRFPDSFSLEGLMYRLRLEVDKDNPLIVSHKLFKVRLLLEPTKTRLNRNQ